MIRCANDHVWFGGRKMMGARVRRAWTAIVPIGLVALSAQPARADTLNAWGWNNVSQLGDDAMTQRNSPVAVIGMDSGVTAIAAGGLHSLAVQNGVLYAWGDNHYGQLGDGTA